MNYRLIFFFILFVCNVANSADIFNAIELRDKKSIYTWLKNKPDLEIVNKDGQSVLIKAVQSGNVHIVDRFIFNGVNLNKVDSFGKNALDYAVELGNRKIAKILIKSKASVTNQKIADDCRQLLKNEHLWSRVICKAIKIICAIGIIAVAYCLVFFLGDGGSIAASFPDLLIGAFFLVSYCVSRSVDKNIEKEYLKVSILEK